MTSPVMSETCIGHESAEQDLVTSWNQKRFPHALLLTGPTGIGKATFAFRIARFLLAAPQEKVTSFHVDPTHPALRRIQVGSHGDLKYIDPRTKDGDPAKEISVEQVRTLNAFLSQTALEGGWRVVILDGTMNRNASNALLKSLEEPPHKTLIILIADSLAKTLPTIRSRCHLVKLLPLDQELLQTLTTDQNPSDIALQLCDGSPGRLQEYLKWDGDTRVADLTKAFKHLVNSPIESLHPFCEKQTAKPKKGEEDALPFLLNLCTQLVYHMIVSQGAKPVDLKDLYSLHSVETWGKVYLEMQRIIQEFTQSHLDRYQTLLSLFGLIRNGRCQ